MDILKAKKPEFAEEIEMILEDELQQSIEESKKKREEEKGRKGIDYRYLALQCCHGDI